MIARSTALFLAVVLVGPTLGVDVRAAHAQTEAIAEPKRDLDLGFPVGGRVATAPVSEGQHVEQGQVLMTLEDEQGAALIALWQQRAASDVAQRVHQKQRALAEMEADRLAELLEKEAAAPFEAQRAAVTAELEALKLEQAHEQHAQAQAQLRQAKARHAQYVLRAPSAGTVERIKVEPGETVEQLQPVLRLVRTDELRVEAAVPLGDTLDLAVGDPAWVSFQVAGHHDQPVRGEVTHIAAVADAASDTRRTSVTVANAHKLPASCRVVVRFKPPPSPAAEAEADTDAVAQGE